MPLYSERSKSSSTTHLTPSYHLVHGRSSKRNEQKPGATRQSGQKIRRHLMTSSSASPFKVPPSVECLCQRHCLGIGEQRLHLPRIPRPNRSGKKIHNPNRICSNCLNRHDLQQLRIWANGSLPATLLINQADRQKQVLKTHAEARGRFLCAFLDPDFQHCRWRLYDLNLRGTRLNCRPVRRKGTACARCWSRHLSKIRIAQHFTPTGLCHEEVDKSVSRSEGSEERTEGSEDDVEGYYSRMS